MTYEYVCKACNHEWEEQQNITDSAKTECPKCKKDKASRLISKSGGFVLNGGGWASSGYSSSK